MKIIRDETGSVTVIALAVLAMMSLLFIAIGFGFSLAHEFRTTQQAADLSALSGAGVVQLNPKQVCKNAELVASRNNVQLESCLSTPVDVVVRVHSLRNRLVKATARAGIF